MAIPTMETGALTLMLMDISAVRAPRGACGPRSPSSCGNLPLGTHRSFRAERIHRNTLRERLPPGGSVLARR